MNKIYLAMLSCFIMAACSSPAKKQHEDKMRRVNELQNVGAGVSDDQENNIASGKLTDSTNTDTTGK